MRSFAFAAFAAFLLLIFTQAHAMELKKPASIEQLDLSYRHYGTLMLSGDYFDYAAVNVTTLQNEDNQEVSLPSEGTLVADSSGNKKLNIVRQNPGKNFQYSASGTAKISAIHTYSLPASYTIPEDAKRFLLPAKHVQSDDPAIKQLARDITAGAANDFEKVALLAVWVNGNVNYTLDLGGEAKDALWVLQNRIGTCDEFTTLFLALARSMGIPAKYISGYVYGSDGWQKHAWAEVYLGKWIPVDATWLEVARLDATHIKFFETDDNYVANEAKAYGSGGKITWLEDNDTFDISGYRDTELMDYEVYVSAGKLGAGGDIAVVAEITPEEYAVDKITLEPCTGMDVLRVEDKSRAVVLLPRKTAVVAWKVSVSPGLDANKLYTCPLVINSNILKRKTRGFEADPRLKSGMKLDAALAKSFFSVGENVTVSVSGEGTPAASDVVGVAADNFFETSAIASKTYQRTFSFQAGTPGSPRAIIFDSAGNVKVLNYTVQKAGDVFIDKMEGPDFAPFGSRPEVRLIIKNSMLLPQNIRLDIKINDRVVPSESFTVPLNSKIPINLSIPSDSAGGVRVSVRLVADSVEEAVKMVRIYAAPNITIDAKYNSGEGSAEVKLVSANDEAKNIEVFLGGKKQTLASSSENKTLYFNVPAGEYDVKVNYEDVAGNKYALEKKISFEESWWDRIVGWVRNILRK